MDVSIISRNKNFTANNCIIVHSIQESLKCMNFQEGEEVFVIGGGEIYRRFLELDLVDKMYITHIDEIFDGDIFFPDFEITRWQTKEILSHQKDEKNPHNFSIIEYIKKD